MYRVWRVARSIRTVYHVLTYCSRRWFSMSVEMGDFKAPYDPSTSRTGIESTEGIAGLDIPVLAWIGAARLLARH